jgi:hypothetical protein
MSNLDSCPPFVGFRSFLTESPTVDIFVLRDGFATCCEKPNVTRQYLVTNRFASYCQRLTFLLSVQVLRFLRITLWRLCNPIFSDNNVGGFVLVAEKSAVKINCVNYTPQLSRKFILTCGRLVTS